MPDMNAGTGMQGYGEMHEDLVHGDSPDVDSIMDQIRENPEMLQMLINSDPSLRAAIEDNPIMQ